MQTTAEKKTSIWRGPIWKASDIAPLALFDFQVHRFLMFSSLLLESAEGHFVKCFGEINGRNVQSHQFFSTFLLEPTGTYHVKCYYNINIMGTICDTFIKQRIAGQRDAFRKIKLSTQRSEDMGSNKSETLIAGPMTLHVIVLKCVCLQAS